MPGNPPAVELSAYRRVGRPAGRGRCDGSLIGPSPHYHAVTLGRVAGQAFSDACSAAVSLDTEMEVSDRLTVVTPSTVSTLRFSVSSVRKRDDGGVDLDAAYCRACQA